MAPEIEMLTYAVYAPLPIHAAPDYKGLEAFSDPCREHARVAAFQPKSLF